MWYQEWWGVYDILHKEIILSEWRTEITRQTTKKTETSLKADFAMSPVWFWPLHWRHQYSTQLSAGTATWERELTETVTHLITNAFCWSWNSLSSVVHRSSSRKPKERTSEMNSCVYVNGIQPGTGVLNHSLPKQDNGLLARDRVQQDQKTTCGARPCRCDEEKLDGRLTIKLGE